MIAIEFSLPKLTQFELLRALHKAIVALRLRTSEVRMTLEQSPLGPMMRGLSITSPESRSDCPMPFYEYECSACKFYVEALQKISDPPLKKCPSCKKATLKKLVSAPAFRLAGGGWYETDFKSDKENKRNLVGEEKESSSEAKTDTKTDTKVETKSDASATKETTKSTDSSTDSKSTPESKSQSEKSTRRNTSSGSKKPAAKPKAKPPAKKK